MTMAIWKPGRRLFSTAALLMLLTAALHTIGNLSARPDAGAEEKLFADMAALHFPLGMGMSPSLRDVYMDLVFTMSITFAALGLLNLMVAGSTDVGADILRRMSWANAIWVGVFVILNVKYQIPPPLISGVVIELVVIASLVVKPKTV